MVLLHQGLGSIAEWRKLVPATTAAGWQVLAFDRWGYGRSDPRPSFAWDFLRHDAEEALALFDELGLGRVALVGHSDGGTIALLLAARYPARVSRLVAVAAHIYYESVTGGGVAAIAQAASAPPLSDSLLREHGEKGQALAVAWTTRWLDPQMRSLSLRTELSDIRCPTLVIQGELDEHATPQHAIDIAAGIPGAVLWLVPGAHHMLPLECPDAFNRRVLEFLAPAFASATSPSG